MGGTLYDITVRGRFPYNDEPGAISPGPARYNHKAGFDSKGLLEKILNVPIPKPRMPQPDGVDEEEEPVAEGYDGNATGQRGRQGSHTRGKKDKTGGTKRSKLTRAES